MVSIFPFETLSGEHQAYLTEVASLSFSNGGVVGKGGWGALSLSHLPVPGLGRVWGRGGNLACVFREQPEHCREFITSRTCGVSPTCCRGIGLPLPSSGGV